MTERLPLETIFGSPETPGVAVVPPQVVHFDIHEQVMQSLAGLPVNHTVAIVRLQTGSGINMAVAHKFDDNWTVEAFVGKTGWQRPVHGGAQVVFSR